MGLFDSVRKFLGSVDHEYDRRIKAASLVKAYDPTGASHHHDHVEVHNEHVESVETAHGNGHTVMDAPTEAEQSNPRKVTHSQP
ncbi:MAG: hypothetical protein CYG59_09760 [Chloroflexi bacterium]|nr:MAG: hypothetical protein CYG59_09760 [Chloroflexota bacterium]